ncbi:MAG TPA: hypothetical protein VJI46_04530 [Candidatus Nanoarchaeia archaeon]|nr:hypothetical protein [Candidatus Nanoarchaeia archaeon]
MAFLDKLKFWKREPELALGPEPELGLEFGRGYEAKEAQMPPELAPQPAYQYPQQPAFQQPFPQPAFGQQMYQQPSVSIEVVAKNIEVLSSKLDVLKATLDAINQRIENIESIARSEQSKRRW